MKNIYIVTGANGFLGNNIVRKLSQNNAEIRALILPTSNRIPLQDCKCNIFEGDVTDIETLKELFKKNDNENLIVIHCAAIVSINSKIDKNIYNVNVNGTKNIVKKVLETNSKLVYVSSVHAIEEKKNRQVITETLNFNPDVVIGAYAKTKATAAKFVIESIEKENLNACIVHPSGIIGPYDFGNTNMTQLIIDFANKKLTSCVDGGYNFVDVRDVADAIIEACHKDNKKECYILSNEYIKIKQLLDLISKIRNTSKIKSILPMWFAVGTASLSEIYYKILRRTPIYTKYSLYTLQSNANFNNEKAKKELNFKTRSIEETLKDTIDFLQKEKRIK